MKRNKEAIAAAFSTMSRLVEQGKPVVFSKLGLSSQAYTDFRKAVTHNFNEKEHGVNLQRIFIEEKIGKYHRNTSPNTNPKDAELIDRIILAMAWIRKHQAHKTPVKQITLADFTLDQLKTEVLRRENWVKKENYAKKLGCSVENLSKVVEEILAVL